MARGSVYLMAPVRLSRRGPSPSLGHTTVGTLPKKSTADACGRTDLSMRLQQLNMRLVDNCQGAQGRVRLCPALHAASPLHSPGKAAHLVCFLPRSCRRVRHWAAHGPQMRTAPPSPGRSHPPAGAPEDLTTPPRLGSACTRPYTAWSAARFPLAREHTQAVCIASATAPRGAAREAGGAPLSLVRLTWWCSAVLQLTGGGQG